MEHTNMVGYLGICAVVCVLLMSGMAGLQTVANAEDTLAARCETGCEGMRKQLLKRRYRPKPAFIGECTDLCVKVQSLSNEKVVPEFCKEYVRRMMAVSGLPRAAATKKLMIKRCRASAYRKIRSAQKPIKQQPQGGSPAVK
ncbi:hypothetical protein ACFL2Q_10410 [Thermodesulfobacteriota bacterium]